MTSRKEKKKSSRKPSTLEIVSKIWSNAFVTYVNKQRTQFDYRHGFIHIDFLLNTQSMCVCACVHLGPIVIIAKVESIYYLLLLPRNVNIDAH